MLQLRKYYREKQVFRVRHSKMTDTSRSSTNYMCCVYLHNKPESLILFFSSSVHTSDFLVHLQTDLSLSLSLSRCCVSCSVLSARWNFSPHTRVRGRTKRDSLDNRDIKIIRAYSSGYRYQYIDSPYCVGFLGYNAHCLDCRDVENVDCCRVNEVEHLLRNFS